MRIKLFEQFSKKWYHGSKETFSDFKLKKGTLLDYNYIAPIFLTSDLEFAEAHAGYKTPHIYEIEVLTDKLFDYKKIPNGYDLFRFLEKDIKKDDDKDYTLGKKLYFDIENKSDDVDRMYGGICSGEYSELEQVWFYDWLKKNGYDGAYVRETGIVNLFIFDTKKLKIIKTITQ
jgi:hypothetical protein